MGSVSISHLIIFIASLLVAASVAGTLIVSVEDVSSSVDQQSDSLTQQIDTDIAIISDPSSPAVYQEPDGGGNGSLTLLVKNTGETTIPTDGSNLDVLVDGQYRTGIDIEVVSGGDRWSSGAVAEVTVDLDDELTDDHRATVIVNGSQATFDFRV